MQFRFDEIDSVVIRSFVQGMYMGLYTPRAALYLESREKSASQLVEWLR